MEGPDRLVLDTQFIDPARNRVRVCTAFLGVDVNFGDGEPILFETVIFGGSVRLAAVSLLHLGRS